MIIKCFINKSTIIIIFTKTINKKLNDYWLAIYYCLLKLSRSSWWANAASSLPAIWFGFLKTFCDILSLGSVNTIKQYTHYTWRCCYYKGNLYTHTFEKLPFSKSKVTICCAGIFLWFFLKITHAMYVHDN